MTEYLDAYEFHHQQVVVDLHVDCLIQQQLMGYDIHKLHEPWMRRQPFINHADIPRMLEGGYSLSVMGIHAIPWEHPKRWAMVWRQLWKLQQIIDFDGRVLLAECADDVLQAKEAGQLAMMAGLEGAHMLGGSLEHLAEAREMGAIYLTLAHFSKNSAATPSMGLGADEVSGLTPWGRKLIKRLESLKMLVDVAHVNAPGVLDACEASTQPVIASHTMCRGLTPHPRGVSDEGMKAIAQTGGVMGVIFSPSFLQNDPPPPAKSLSWWRRWPIQLRRLDASLNRVVDHICYIADKVGPEYVAIGTDFDGWIPTIPNDMRDCRDLPLLTERLLARGLHEDEIRGILGQNFLRVLRAVRGS